MNRAELIELMAEAAYPRGIGLNDHVPAWKDAWVVTREIHIGIAKKILDALVAAGYPPMPVEATDAMLIRSAVAEYQRSTWSTLAIKWKKEAGL